MATMSTKICRKEHLGKSCNAKWRELTGTTEQILPEINETVELCVGGKLTKFHGHEGITENHESFYSRKFLSMW